MKLGVLDNILNKVGLREELEKTEKPLASEDEKILSSREKSSSKFLNSGVNETIFVELRDDGKGVFKPKNGERLDYYNIPRGTLYKRERAAYLVDMMLDFRLVPPTVIRDMDGRIGSLQRFIEDSKTIYEISGEDRGGYTDEIMKMWLFDYIVWNCDRHSGNFLVKNKKIYAIDNGQSFGEAELKVYSTYYDRGIPQDIIDKINDFLSSDKKEILRTLLEELVSSGEADACLKRIEKLGKVIVEGAIPRDASEELTFN